MVWSRSRVKKIVCQTIVTYNNRKHQKSSNDIDTASGRRAIGGRASPAPPPNVPNPRPFVAELEGADTWDVVALAGAAATLVLTLALALAAPSSPSESFSSAFTRSSTRPYSQHKAYHHLLPQCDQILIRAIAQGQHPNNRKPSAPHITILAAS